MNFRRQSSLQNAGTLLRVWGLCGVACFAMVSTAFGQIFGPTNGRPTPEPIYGEPTTEPVYSPHGVQSAFAQRQAGLGPTAFDSNMELPNANGIQEPGALQQVNFSQALGDYGNVRMYGSPTADGGFGAQYRAVPSTWGHVRDLQVGVYTNEEQTVVNGGFTMEVYTNDRFGIGTRVLAGGSNYINQKDEYHFSGDLYAGTTLLENHWLKFGWFYDVQDNFHKLGPAFGALLWADHKHPISLDIAYGIGYGDPVRDVVNLSNVTLLRVADDDTQVRAGTYVTPNLQVGFSGNWLNWADGRFEDYNGYGGFVAWNYGDLAVNVDLTHGDDKTRGFVNVAYTFGGRRPRLKNAYGEPIVVEHPRDWITKPVMRDVSLQVQQQQVDFFPITNVFCRLVLPTRVPSGGDSNGNGVIDAGEIFELDVILANNSDVQATGVALAVTPSTITGPAVQIGDFGTVQSVVNPGESVSTDSISDICIQINSNANVGDQIFVQFSVDANGETRRFQCGPFIVGQTAFTGSFDPATQVSQ
ncbi:MAG: hypothetical protein KDA84_09345 [Planctomycetaceae bacterium]|nr:hypothetical protein [Planctomycetaceae bacterium]